MKKTILYLLLFLCNATVFAEEELNSAANFQGTYFVITPEGQHTTLYIEPYKDIMLNEQQYWQYSGNFDGTKFVKSLLLLRKMGTKYFSYDTKTNTEHLLFDFGLKQGDTFTNSFNGVEYDVIDVRDTLVNNKSLCLIELQSQEGNHDIWMEGVGSIYTGIMQPNDYCKEIYMLTSHRYYITGYDENLVFYCFYPNDQYIKTADMSIAELQWEGGKIETDEDWEAYQEWLYSPTDLKAEFVGDTLHVWGRLRSSCVLQPYAACVLMDNNAVTFTTYSYAEVDCISNYYIETHIPGFKKGKYSVKLSWDETIELECPGTNEEPASGYFPEGTKWTEIRLDTLQYNSWYSKVNGEWVPNFETIEYRVQGEYIDEIQSDRYSCVYTNGSEWTDSLTLLIYGGKSENEINWYGLVTVAAFNNGQLLWPFCGQMYPLSFEVGTPLSSLSIETAGATGGGWPWEWDEYGIVEEIKEGDFGGVRPLNYSDVNGIRFIQGIGVASWNDGECIFGPLKPYEVLSGVGMVESNDRHYRSMLVHFERNGEVLYDVWPEKGTTDVEINETTFPDGEFRNWVLSQDYGKDGVLTEEEIAGITSIDVAYKKIQNIAGIEYFTSLTVLNCYKNQLTSLDVSNNTELTTLCCTTNQLTNLDVSKCINLTHLECIGNQLTKLDVSNNTALNELHCSGNNLTALDLSKNLGLTNLNCHGNQLTELDVSKNTALKRIWCSENLLTSLDVSGCTLLESLKCAKNRLTMLEVSGCPELWEIFCHNNQIRGEAMDEFIEGLPTVPNGWGHLCIIDPENEQNVMTKSQVAAAKAKSWHPRYKYGAFGTPGYTDYEGIDDPVTFTQGQMATIILPTEPDASKGKYYRLDKCEDGQIIFEQELQPQARVPYIIIPNEDFSIDPSTMDLEGLSHDAVSIEGISFIGSYSHEEFSYQEGFYIDIIDTTPDCLDDWFGSGKAIVGPLRAYLQVNWDDPYTQGGTRSPQEKMEIVLKDNPNGINSLTPDISPGRGEWFMLDGRKLVSKPTQKGIYINNGRKVLK